VTAWKDSTNLLWHNNCNDVYIFKDMSKKKTSKKIKRVSMKEIVDAFYSGVSVCKITKMAQQLVKQEEVRKY
jgi:hypothetical protein